jgi:L,D-peptidoglycan transpeptidase YkuD (ErfK/YbiS/YcfS/YnhG family)
MTDVVLVIADDWSSTKATMTHWRFAGSWTQDGASWPAVIGDAGLAWGDGLHGDGAPKGHAGPSKHEGDHRSPAGAFRIGTRFGFAPSTGRLLSDTTECVDDPKSAFYNEIVEHTGSADWTSSEHMRSVEQYKIGAVIDHNPKRIPGDGSCIFLHIWAGPDSTTVGCTAMDQDKLAELLDSLGEKPVFVLLPKAEYEALRKPWGLPAL